MLSMDEVADRINAAFRLYGLDHDVVVVEGSDLQEHMVLVNGDDPSAMHTLALSIQHLCEDFVRNHPEQAGQLRLF